jgi:hypothetical protein
VVGYLAIVGNAMIDALPRIARGHPGIRPAEP